MENLFYEQQRFRHPLFILIIGFIALIQYYIFFKQIVQGVPVGSNPAPDSMAILFFIVFGIIFPIFFFSLTLKTTVYDNGIRVQFFPITKSKWLPTESIASFEIMTYNALLEYGGWGIRWGRDGKAYNISGNTGLRLTMKNGSTLLIGTQKPEELHEAMDSIGKRI